MNGKTPCALLSLILGLVLCAPLAAQEWSFGVASGPFLFGKFAERSQIVGSESDRVVLKTSLSATTRAGLEIDLERRLNDYFAVRGQASFTDAPLTLKTKGGGTSSGAQLAAGQIRVTTFILPVVVQLNPHGAIRFHLLGGPAYANYDFRRTAGQSSGSTIVVGSRGRFGGAAGAGVAWWWNDRFAVEGQIVDIVTASPLDDTDFTTPLARTQHISKPQNVHTTVGIRYRF
jgi:hypothetical protein